MVARLLALDLDGAIQAVSKGQTLAILAGMLGVAVGNAAPRVRQAARYLAAPMQRDGAAEPIKRFVLAETDA